MRMLLFNSELLAREVLAHVSDDEESTTPKICCEIFDIDVDHNNVQELLKTEEFNKTCLAVDYLIEEGLVSFNGETGILSRSS